MDKMKLSAFWDLLDKHDWYYAFSDDGRVYERGAGVYSTLNRIADQSKEHSELMKAFHEHNFSGEPWNTEKQPKPKRPVD